MLNGKEMSDFFHHNIGGNAYWQMLKRAGYDNEEIRTTLEFHMESRETVIEFMGGREAYLGLRADWREAMFVMSALRYMCEDLGAWKPTQPIYELEEKFAAVGGYDSTEVSSS